MATLLDIVKKGSTDRSVCIRIIDSGDGTPETGVVYNTSGIDLWYRREGAAVTSITEATLAALTTAHADGGFLHVGNGEYRLDLPDAAFATGANYVDIGGTVTGMIVIGGRVRLVNYDPEDTVRLGLTALPNAAADAAGGLPISDAGGLDLDARLDAAISSRQVSLWAAASSTVSLTNTTIANVSAVTSVAALGTGAITAASIATDAIDADALATDAVNEIRNAITGGAYDLDTDANGRIRVVDGTAAGEINTASGVVQAALADGVTHGGTTADFLARDISIGGDVNVVGSVVLDNAGNDIRGVRLSTTGINAVADQVWLETLADHSGTAGSTAAALNAAGSAGDPWATALPGAYGAGTAGKIIGDNINATISSRSSHSAADVWAVATRVLTAGTNIALAKGTGVTGFNDLSAANVTAAVWEANVDLNDNTVGSFGDFFGQLYEAATVDIQNQITALNDLDAAGIRAAIGLASANLDTQLDALPTANEVRNAVTGGAYALDTDANGRVRIVDGTGPGEIDTNGGAIASVLALGTQAKADVNAEVVDALNVDTYAEPSQGTPPATAALTTKINYLYTALRNKVEQDEDEYRLYADDATTVLVKRALSELAGVLSVGEMATGA